MKKPATPNNEAQRQEALNSLDILDTHAETAYDDLTLVASQICQTPMAVISLIDKDRQWFKSRIGIGDSETPRSVSFCAHAINGTDILEVQDAQLDDRFSGNPYVTGDPSVRFYAGAPLVLSTGEVMGTICVIDKVPKKLDEAQKAALRTLARNAVMQMELRSQITFMVEREAALNRMIKQNLEEAKARSEFFARISHEVRAPMNGILGMLQAMGNGNLDSDQKECLAVAQQSGEALLHLINDVMDIATIESGKLTLEKIDFDLELTTQRTVQLFSWLAKSKGIELNFNGLGKQLSVISDPTRTSQILTNLIANAVKFTQSGGVMVTLKSTPASDSPTTKIEISVSDTGIGMSEDTIKTIFDPFTQGPSSTHRQFGGTGLGLAISRNLAEALNGHLSCASVLNQGSTFTLTMELPIGTGSTESKPIETEKNLNFDHVNILIAEDNETNSAVYNAFFRILGCEHTIVSDGLKAAEAARNNTYDLILMDRHMPVCDGIEATRMIREFEKPLGRRTPIIAISATNSTAEHHEFLTIGMDDILAKPLVMKDLQKKMEKWVPRDKKIKIA